MTWNVLFHPEVVTWIASLDSKDRDRAVAALAELGRSGPSLGRPFVDSIRGSVHSNMKELRPRGGHLRILFAFGQIRCAVVLVGGDKRQHWRDWYVVNIPLADSRFSDHLTGSDWARAQEGDRLK